MFDDVMLSIKKFIEESDKIHNNPDTRMDASHCVGLLLEMLENKYGSEIISATRRIINQYIEHGRW